MWDKLDKIRRFFGIKRLYIYIIRSYLAPLLLTFVIAVFILLMQFLWKYIDDMVGKGFEWYVITELLFYASATFVPMALPLAILLASLMTFGNLGENYELVAIKSSGISFRKAMLPLTLFTLIICGCAFYFSNWVLPVANLKFGTLLFDVREKKPALNINEGVFYDEIDNYVIRVGSKERDGKTLNDIMIFDHTAQLGNINVIIAKTGYMEKSPDNRYLIFKLYEGYNYHEMIEKRENIDNRPMQRTKFAEEMIRFDLSEFSMQRSKEELFKDNYQMLNIIQLEDAIDSLVIRFEDRKKQLHRYILQSFRYYVSVDSNNSEKLDNMVINSSGNDFLSKCDKNQKLNYIDNALKSARGVSQQMEFSANEFIVKYEGINKHKVEWHRKFTLSFACLVLFLIGAPMGAIIRRGGLGLPVVFATLFFILYHIISITGEKFAKEGVMPVYEGMWMASVIFLPIGLILTYYASTDSPLLDMDMIIRFFKKLVFWRRKNDDF